MCYACPCECACRRAALAPSAWPSMQATSRPALEGRCGTDLRGTCGRACAGRRAGWRAALVWRNVRHNRLVGCRALWAAVSAITQPPSAAGRRQRREQAAAAEASLRRGARRSPFPLALPASYYTRHPRISCALESTAQLASYLFNDVGEAVAAARKRRRRRCCLTAPKECAAETAPARFTNQVARGSIQIGFCVVAIARRATAQPLLAAAAAAAASLPPPLEVVFYDLCLDEFRLFRARFAELRESSSIEQTHTDNR
jgi:hypothetical protein